MTQPAKMAMTQPYLTEKLSQLKKMSLSALDGNTRATIVASLDKLSRSEVAQTAKNVGDIAPNFCLPNVKGQYIHLEEILQTGPVVLSFYRGGWCPYCNLELQLLQHYLPLIKAFDARLIAISPEAPDQIFITAKPNQLNFEVVSDQEYQVTRQYGLIYTLFEEMYPIYQMWKSDLHNYNRNNSYELSAPATYIIDKKGIIKTVYLALDYTTRMEPADVIKVLQVIKNTEALAKR